MPEFSHPSIEMGPRSSVQVLSTWSCGCRTRSGSDWNRQPQTDVITSVTPHPDFLAWLTGAPLQVRICLCTIIMCRPSSQSGVSAHGFGDPGNAAWAEHFSRGGGMTSSARQPFLFAYQRIRQGVNINKVLKSWPTFLESQGMLGVCEPSWLASFARSDWVGSSSTRVRGAQ